MPPFRIRKAPKRDLYWVVGPDGKHHSKDPIPKQRAEAQRRALYLSESKRGGADSDSDSSSDGGSPKRKLKGGTKTKKQLAEERKAREDEYFDSLMNEFEDWVASIPEKQTRPDPSLSSRTSRESRTNTIASPGPFYAWENPDNFSGIQYRGLPEGTIVVYGDEEYELAPTASNTLALGLTSKRGKEALEREILRMRGPRLQLAPIRRPKTPESPPVVKSTPVYDYDWRRFRDKHRTDLEVSSPFSKATNQSTLDTIKQRLAILQQKGLDPQLALPKYDEEFRILAGSGKKGKKRVGGAKEGKKAEDELNELISAFNRVEVAPRPVSPPRERVRAVATAPPPLRRMRREDELQNRHRQQRTTSRSRERKPKEEEEKKESRGRGKRGGMERLTVAQNSMGKVFVTDTQDGQIWEFPPRMLEEVKAMVRRNNRMITSGDRLLSKMPSSDEGEDKEVAEAFAPKKESAKKRKLVFKQ